MTGMHGVARWMAILLGAMTAHVGIAEERDYAKVMAACGRNGAEQVSFFSAFGGLWPVGPISNATAAALECYAATARLTGRVCD